LGQSLPRLRLSEVRTGKILRFSEPESQKSFKNRALRAPENIFTRGKSAKIASRAKNADPAKMTHSVPTFLTCTCNEFSNILPIVREKPANIQHQHLESFKSMFL
jgi:hypothetical protein